MGSLDTGNQRFRSFCDYVEKSVRGEEEAEANKLPGLSSNMDRKSRPSSLERRNAAFGVGSIKTRLSLAGAAENRVMSITQTKVSV